jgi:hypothetical protein
MRRFVLVVSIICICIMVSSAVTAETLVVEWVPSDNIVTGKWGDGRDYRIMPADGLDLVETPDGDGPWELTEVDGEIAVTSVPHRHHPNNFFYFRIDDSVAHLIPNGTKAIVAVEYYDAGFEALLLSYDSWENAFKSTPVIFSSMNTHQWRIRKFEVKDARFANGVFSCDFRVLVRPKMIIRKVTVEIAL